MVVTTAKSVMNKPSDAATGLCSICKEFAAAVCRSGCGARLCAPCAGSFDDVCRACHALGVSQIFGVGGAIGGSPAWGAPVWDARANMDSVEYGQAEYGQRCPYWWNMDSVAPKQNSPQGRGTGGGGMADAPRWDNGVVSWRGAEEGGRKGEGQAERRQRRGTPGTTVKIGPMTARIDNAKGGWNEEQMGRLLDDARTAAALERRGTPKGSTRRRAMGS